MDILTYAKHIYNLKGHDKLRYVKKTLVLYELLVKKTSFLPIKSTPTVRAYCIVHNITQIPTCPICNTELQYIPNKKSFPIYCSKKCTTLDSTSINEKRKRSCLERFGYDYAVKSPEVLKKRQDTMLNRYGVEYSMQNDTLKQKQQETMMNNHGVKHALQNQDILSKRKNNNKQKYGVEHTSQLEKVQEKVKETRKQRKHLYRYKDSKVIAARQETMKLKYGTKHFFQQHLSNKSINKLNDINFLIQEHHNNEKTLQDISEDVGCSDSTVNRYMKKYNIKTKHFFISSAEKQIRDFINLLDVDIECNVRTIIHPYELDIYIPEHNLAIEYCGLYWHSEQQGKDKWYHYNKWNMCNNKNIRLITIFEDEWLFKLNICKKMLRNLLGKNNTLATYARNSTIVEVKSDVKREFFDNNHIQGNGPGSINIGLEYEGTLVACMSFIKQKNQHYLNRYATSCNVPGGFSKLLKYFQNNYEWQHLISFADLRWSNGNLYEKTGWSKIKTLNPDYSYIQSNKRKHKFGFRHSLLSKKLKNYNPKLTETQNCNNNGLSRIWDCGKLKFIIDK